MNIPSRQGGPQTASILSSAQRTLRSGRLLATAAGQHLVDDPALLAIQVSRRLPFGARMIVGRALEKFGAAVPAVSALGSVMTGRDAQAERSVERAHDRSGWLMPRLAGEVAILVGRVDLIPTAAPAATRARAAWSQGQMNEALSIVDKAGQGHSRYARRLRSELKLLEPGFRLPVPATMSAREQGGPKNGEPLRVLHLLTNSLPHTQSGYSLRSHRILTALRDQGVESVALTRTGYPVMVGILTARPEDVVDGIRYVRTLPSRLPQTQQERLQAEVARAMELTREFRPHVIHATTNYQNALVAQAVSDATGLPWVFEVRGLMEQTWVASHKNEVSRLVAASSERHDSITAKEGEQARDADAVVTLSATMADELSSRGVERSDITLVPNGVDGSLLEDHVDSSEARTLTGLDALPGFGSGAYLVGAVSALVDYEGYDVLLRAAAQIVSDEEVPEVLRERIAIVLAGDGVSRPGLQDLAESLGLGDRVHFPGRVPRDEARRWIEALDVVVVPRLDEAVTRAVTPQKPVEALALGRPLIVSDLPALREVVSAQGDDPLAATAVAGDTSSLAHAIVSMYRTGPPDELLVKRGKDIARQRLWPELIVRYRKMYGTVVAENGSTAAEKSGGDPDGV